MRQRLHFYVLSMKFRGLIAKIIKIKSAFSSELFGIRLNHTRVLFSKINIWLSIIVCFRYNIFINIMFPKKKVQRGNQENIKTKANR